MAEAAAPPRAPPAQEPDLIDMMNDLQSKLLLAGLPLDVDLPQIVVVGAQSSGKSSTLENFVGREFLPRGKGVVTRRPTLIHLHPTQGEEYVVFGSNPTMKVRDYEAVKAEILKQMPNNGFSSIPIELKIYSPRVLKLSLVDLPGLIRNAVDDQPADSVREVREMVLNYIRKEQTLILAVSPANQDIASSEALEVTREVDPNRVRTIGVLTKLDLMDEGTDARDILENKQIYLKRGYVGVLNRSQVDIDEKRDIQYILAREKNFFQDKECYKSIANRMGTPYLVRNLQKTLRIHIKNALPKLRNRLAEKLSGIQRRLDQLYKETGDAKVDKKSYVLRLVHMFTNDVKVQLMGNSEKVDMEKVSYGAFIYYKLNTEVMKNLKMEITPNDEEMTIVITNLNGLRGTISFPSLSLDAMCRKLISAYESPMLISMECIKKVLVESFESSANLLNRYPMTKHEVLYWINEKLKDQAARLQDRMKDHLKAEMFYINLDHPDLDLGLCDPVVPAVGPSKVWTDDAPDGAMAQSIPDDVPEGNEGSSEKQRKNKQLIRILMANNPTQKKVQYLFIVVTKYMEIVQKQITDFTIKYILRFLVKEVLDFILDDLSLTLLSSANFASLIADCEEDFQLREELEESSRVLKEALAAVMSF